jgi:hypothetical protein
MEHCNQENRYHNIRYIISVEIVDLHITDLLKNEVIIEYYNKCLVYLQKMSAVSFVQQFIIIKMVGGVP